MDATKELPPSLLATMNPNKKTGQSTAAAAQDRFMTLLITQMKNQDPLNPMDNAQVTSQLAQLSTVSGIDKLNSTVESLMSSFQASQTLQATAMLGHGVLMKGSDINLSGGKGLMGVDLTSPVDNLKVTIRNASGIVVNTMNLGSQEVGTLPLAWDGKTDKGSDAPDGKYKFYVEATRGGVPVDVPNVVSVVVLS